MSLNKNQKSSLAVALVYLDQAILDLERLLKSPDNGIIVKTSDGLDDSTKAELLKMAGESKTEIISLKNNFNIDDEIGDVSGILLGKLAYCWSILEDMRFDHLGNSGSVDPNIKDKYEPHIDRLSKLFWDAKTLLTKDTSSHTK